MSATTAVTGGGDPQSTPAASPAAVSRLERYYRLHARIYDLTRWSFLFGRRSLLHRLPAGASPREVLEIGCGTGAVLATMAEQLPQARLEGVDLSGEMLAVAGRRCRRLGERVRLRHGAYGEAEGHEGRFDLVVASYALSMFNPGWERAIEQALRDLRPGGRIAIVDFHDSPLAGFRRWMGMNHVRLEGHLLPRLASRFEIEHRRVRRAYGGLWRYFEFVGRKRCDV